MKSSAVVETLEIAKHDERGRRIADAQEKEALMVGFAASGMTQRAFALREGINPFTFAGWMRQKRMDEAKRRRAEQLGRDSLSWVAQGRHRGFAWRWCWRAD